MMDTFWMSEYGQSVMHTRSEIDTLLEKSSTHLEQLFDVEELLQQCSNKNHTLIEFLERPENIKKLILYITRSSEENIRMVSQQMNAVWESPFDNDENTNNNNNNRKTNNNNNNNNDNMNDNSNSNDDNTNWNDGPNKSSKDGNSLLDPPNNDNGILVTKQQNKNKNKKHSSHSHNKHKNHRKNKYGKPLVYSEGSDIPPPPPPPPGAPPPSDETKTEKKETKENTENNSTNDTNEDNTDTAATAATTSSNDENKENKESGNENENDKQQDQDTSQINKEDSIDMSDSERSEGKAKLDDDSQNEKEKNGSGHSNDNDNDYDNDMNGDDAADPEIPDLDFENQNKSREEKPYVNGNNKKNSSDNSDPNDNEENDDNSKKENENESKENENDKNKDDINDNESDKELISLSSEGDDKISRRSNDPLSDMDETEGDDNVPTKLGNDGNRDPLTELQKNKIKLKYPYLASEILNCQIPSILDAILNPDNEYLNLLFDFIEQDAPLDAVLTNYWRSCIVGLVRRNSNIMLEYIKNRENVLTYLVQHIRDQSIMELVIALGWDPAIEELKELDDVADWMYEEGLVPKLIAMLSSQHSSDEHSAASYTLVDIVAKTSRSTNLVLFRNLSSEEQVIALMKHMFVDNRSSLLESLSVLLALLHHYPNARAERQMQMESGYTPMTDSDAPPPPPGEHMRHEHENDTTDEDDTSSEEDENQTPNSDNETPIELQNTPNDIEFPVFNENDINVTDDNNNNNNNTNANTDNINNNNNNDNNSGNNDEDENKGHANDSENENMNNKATNENDSIIKKDETNEKMENKTNEKKENKENKENNKDNKENKEAKMNKQRQKSPQAKGASKKRSDKHGHSGGNKGIPPPPPPPAAPPADDEEDARDEQHTSKKMFTNPLAAAAAALAESHSSVQGHYNQAAPASPERSPVLTPTASSDGTNHGDDEEDENDRKERDGLPSVVKVVCDKLDDFKTLLQDAPTEILELPFTTLNPPLGPVRHKIIDMIVALMRTPSPIVSQKLRDLKFVQLCIDLFFQYPWNNLLHGSVEHIVQMIVSGDCEVLKRALFEDCKFLDKILEAREKSKRHQKQHGFRLGFMGHLTRIANTIVEFSKRSKILADYMNDNERWMEFIDSELRHENEKLNTQLGGHRPSTLTDEDDFLFTLGPGMSNGNNQMEETQNNQSSRPHIDDDGMLDDELTGKLRTTWDDDSDSDSDNERNNDLMHQYADYHSQNSNKDANGHGNGNGNENGNSNKDNNNNSMSANPLSSLNNKMADMKLSDKTNENESGNDSSNYDSEDHSSEDEDIVDTAGVIDINELQNGTNNKDDNDKNENKDNSKENNNSENNSNNNNNNNNNNNKGNDNGLFRMPSDELADDYDENQWNTFGNVDPSDWASFDDANEGNNNSNDNTNNSKNDGNSKSNNSDNTQDMLFDTNTNKNDSNNEKRKSITPDTTAFDTFGDDFGITSDKNVDFGDLLGTENDFFAETTNNNENNNSDKSKDSNTTDGQNNN